MLDSLHMPALGARIGAVTAIGGLLVSPGDLDQVLCVGRSHWAVRFGRIGRFLL